MIRHVIRGIAIAAGAAAVPLALAVPGSAEIVWGDNHIGNQAGAPTAVGDPFGYTTTLTGQGPAARAVYRAAGGHIEELSLLIPNQGWHAPDLTALTHPPAAASAPYCLPTTPSGPARPAGGRARAASAHTTHLPSAGGGWSAVDLTAHTGAPTAAGAPFGYTTTLTDQGPAARVVYRTAGRHIEELALPSGGAWQADDLTAVPGAPDTARAPLGYPTTPTGQAPAAPVVYPPAGDDVQGLTA